MTYRFSSSDEPFRPSPKKGENENTEAYLDHLRKRGRRMRGFPNLGECGIPDAEEDLECMGIPIFKEVFEAKSYLQSRYELERLKNQMKKYIASGEYIGGTVLIWLGAREDLYDELMTFCNRLSLKCFLPCNIRVKRFYKDVEKDEDTI